MLELYHFLALSSRTHGYSKGRDCGSLLPQIHASARSLSHGLSASRCKGPRCVIFHWPEWEESGILVVAADVHQERM